MPCSAVLMESLLLMSALHTTPVTTHTHTHTHADSQDLTASCSYIYILPLNTSLRLTSSPSPEQPNAVVSSFRIATREGSAIAPMERQVQSRRY